MKKILVGVLISLFITTQVFGATGWLKGKPAGTDNPATLDTTIGENNAALDLMLSTYIMGCRVIFDTVAQITVEAGGVMVSNSTGAVRLMLANAAATTVTWADLDTGSEAASTTYYVYAVGSATTDTTFTVKISASSTAPSGITYYKKLGSFYNNASSNITIIYDDKFTITKYMLKTTLGEISASGTLEYPQTLPGGEYGFWPQLKGGTAVTQYMAGILISGNSLQPLTTSYVTTLSMRADGGATIYAQQRYVTASGEDMWIFLLIDKATDEIVGAYAANDHPAYGNGGDFDKLPHPFGDYNTAKYEIILIEKDTSEMLKNESETTDKSILTLVNEEYKPKMSKKEVYIPLHSGKYITKDNKQVKELVVKLPDYISVRKLTKLTPEEKENKRLVQEAERIASQEKQQEEALVKKEIKNQTIKALKDKGVILKHLKEE